MDVTIKVDAADLQRRLTVLERVQLPFAQATALNALAFDLMRAEAIQVGKVFLRPRPFTQKATQVERKATKASASAVVSVRPAQAAYLRPYEFGGVHHLPGKALLNPKDVPLDQYGQLTKGKIKALLASPNVFAATIRGITGIWRRPKRGTRRDGTYGTIGSQKGLVLLVRLGSALQVHEHLHWMDTAQAFVVSKWPAAFDAAMKKAVATAKL